MFLSLGHFSFYSINSNFNSISVLAYFRVSFRYVIFLKFFLPIFRTFFRTLNFGKSLRNRNLCQYKTSGQIITWRRVFLSGCRTWMGESTHGMKCAAQVPAVRQRAPWRSKYNKHKISIKPSKNFRNKRIFLNKIQISQNKTLQYFKTTTKLIISYSKFFFSNRLNHFQGAKLKFFEK